MSPILYLRRVFPVLLSAAVVCTGAFALESDRNIVQYVHTAWGQREGAPTGILALAQTTDGFLWVGSVDGLYRFDGVNFELRIPGTVRALLALPNGDLWIGRSSAVTLLRKGLRTDYTVGDGVPEGKVWGFAEDGEGTVWASTSVGLARLEGNRWKQVGLDWNFNEASATGMVLDRHGTFWVAAGHTILYLPQGSHKFQTTGIEVNQVWTLVEAPNGKLWMSETSRSVRPIPLGRDLPPSDKTEFAVGSIGFIFDREGSLWISSIGDGMRRVKFPERMEDRRFERNDSAMETFTVAEGLTDNLITAILEDREGNIWVGTNNGLDRFYKSKLVPIMLPFPLLRPVIAPGEAGSVWVSATNQSLRIDSSGRVVMMPGKIYYSAYRGPDGALWWCGEGILDQDKPGARDWPLFHVTRTPIDPTTKSVQDVRITEDRNGVIWAASESGLIYSFSRGQWKRFETFAAPRGYGGSAAFTDWAGRVWLGFQEGTLVLLEAGKVKRSWSGRDSPVGHIAAAITGRDRHIWLGGDKLEYFDGEQFYEVAPDDKPHFKVWGIEETQDGNLWLCEGRGVVHISAAELARFFQNHDYRVQYDIYDSLDGLPGSFHAAALLSEEIQGTDGRIWFSSTKGIAWINPADVSKNLLPPPVSILSMKADGKEFPALGVTLPPLATALEIDYTALSLSVPERVRFRYRMEGVDKDWEAAGSRRAAFYTRLRPGKYKFQVIACNNDGIWNQQGATLVFWIAPTWYQTKWFQAFCSCIFLLLLWSFYQLRVRQLKRQFSLAIEARVDERTQIARELHDTLIQSVDGLMLYLQAAIDEPDRERSQQMLEKALDRADAAISEGRERVYTLRTEPVAVNDLSQALTDYGKERAQDHAIEFSMTQVGKPRSLDPITRDEVFRIGREALTNAFQHAGASKIEVELTYDPNESRLRIRDDGSGIDPQVAKMGRPGHWGLSGMRERAHKVGAELNIWSGPNAGTEVDLRIPARVAYRRRFRIFLNFWIRI
jgi:signal transduction histidine kinase/ligand-binding sensor domain-containing protein